MTFYDIQLVSGITSASTTSPYDFRNAQQLTGYLSGSGTLSAGTIQLEASDDPNFSGTWAPLGSAVNATTLSGNKKSTVSITGPHRYVRATIAGVTGGGNVSVRVVAC